MDPVSIGLVVAAGASAVSGVQASREATRQGRFERDIHNYNAQLEKIAAKEAGRKAALKARQFRRSASKRQAQNRAALAKTGIELEGSPLLVLQEDAANAELDEFLIRRQGQIERQGLESAAQLSLIKGKFSRDAARSKKRSILIDTTADVAGTLSKLKKK